jgi:hypothetical protein
LRDRRIARKDWCGYSYPARPSSSRLMATTRVMPAQAGIQMLDESGTVRLLSLAGFPRAWE